MSLKAKIEAVIYASEEPITLAQLAGLLGDEAQAELDALTAQQMDLDSAVLLSESKDDDDALNAEVMDTSEVADQTKNTVILSGASQPHREAESKDPDAVGTTAASATLSTPAPDPTRLAREKTRRLRDYLRSLLDQLIADYASSDRGLEIREVAGGYRLATKPEYHDAVRGFVKSLKPPLKLTLQALETLAVIAYKQPVTAPEISEIRGVDSSGVLGSLLTRKLIATAGRKQVIGRPILYKTTKDFLLRFGLKDINELPSIEEFEKMAGELNGELDGTVQEELDMEQHRPNAPEETTETTGGSAPLAEADAVPQPTHILHDTPEDLESDDSTHPEGHDREPAHPAEVEP